jgi:hypothetical protein
MFEKQAIIDRMMAGIISINVLPLFISIINITIMYILEIYGINSCFEFGPDHGIYFEG